MDQALEAWSIVSGILFITHPHQYRMGHEIHESMIRRNRCGPTISRWPSIQTAISIISNRSTPFHRDEKSQMQWYDLLCSVGEYDKAPLYLSPINVRVDNLPGSVCAFSGMALRHGVRKCSGSRISFAWYLRDDVRRGEGVEPADWMTQRYYDSYIGWKGTRIKWSSE